MNKIIISNKPEDTFNLGVKLAGMVKAGDIICLSGDLGVGKTVFTQGFANGLGIKEHITSPTFTIVNEYRECELPLFHFDAYRIEESDELYEIGYEEYFFGEGVCLVEWAENIIDLIPENAKRIVISKDLTISDNYRKIEVIGFEDFSD